MNEPARYFVQFEGRVNGPYRLDQLQELAVGSVIKPSFLTAVGMDGPWAPLDTLPEAMAIFPRRAAAALKESEFETLNERGGRGVDARELIAAAQTEGPLLRPAGQADVGAATNDASRQPLNDVQETVRAVQAVEAKFAAPLPPPPKAKMSRSFKWVAALSALWLLALGAIRIAYASRWDQTSSMILAGWAVLGQSLLVGIYFLFRKTEG